MSSSSPPSLLFPKRVDQQPTDHQPQQDKKHERPKHHATSPHGTLQETEPKGHPQHDHKGHHQHALHEEAHDSHPGDFLHQLQLLLDEDHGDRPRRRGASSTTTATVLREVMGSVRSIELQLLAFIMVFGASGLVPTMDLCFPILATLYILFLSKHVFPNYPTVERVSQHSMGAMSSYTAKERFVEGFVVVGIVLGFFLPLAYVLGGFSRGDQRAARAATPHIFLLSAQMLSELLVSSGGDNNHFSPPVRFLLTLLYTTRRLFTLFYWTSDELLSHTHEDAKKSMWLKFGKWLAIANFIYANINIFVCLIPRFQLLAFEKYIEAKNIYTPHEAMLHSHGANSTLKIGKKDEEKKKEDSSHANMDIATRIEKDVKGKAKAKEDKVF